MNQEGTQSERRVEERAKMQGEEKGIGWGIVCGCIDGYDRWTDWDDEWR